MKKKDRIAVVSALLLSLVIVVGGVVFIASRTDNNTAEVYNQDEIATPVFNALEAPIPELEDAIIAPEVYSVKMSVVGDLMVHVKQAEDALRKGGGVYDYNYSFSYIKKYFSGSEIVAGNLETVLGGEKIGYRDFPMFSVTDEFAGALKNAGFNVLTTTNNHCLDQGEAGLLRTILVLDSLEISHFGTYSSEETRGRVLIVEENNIKFAFLSYTYGTNGIAVPEGRPWLVNIMDEALIKADIARAKEENPDFIIVIPHMGNEYETTTKQVFKNWVNLMFEAGADIVLASHPHVLQPAEFVEITDADGTVRTCFVAYSMGNFVSSQRTKPRDAGIIYNLYFEKTEGEKAVLKDVSYVPTWVKYYGADGGYDIAVLPVYDTIKAYLGEPQEGGPEISIRPQDFTRLKEVLAETTSTVSGSPVTADEMESEIFLKRAFE